MSFAKFLHDLTNQKPSKFAPNSFYNKFDDSLNIQWNGEAFFADNISTEITLFRKHNDKNDIIGTQILNFSEILDKGGFGIDDNDNIYEISTKLTRKEKMRDLLQKASKTKFQPCVFYDKDNDTVESYWSNESFYGKYINTEVTVYFKHHSDTADKDTAVGAMTGNITSILHRDGFNF